MTDTTAAEVVSAFVEAFIEAWPREDADGLTRFFAEDAIYENGPLEPVQGRDAISAALGGFMALGGQVNVYIRHLIAEGSVVMTERVDHFVTEDRTISLPVMGVFEVHDGVIAAWRDYFDLNQFTSKLDSGASP